MHDNDKKWQLILASASPRRKELLGWCSVPFKIMASNLPEHSDAADPAQFALDIATVKGEGILSQLRYEQKYVVVSADTIVVLEGKILGKPKDTADAQRMLQFLAAKTHQVFTAVVIHYSTVTGWNKLSFVEESKVSFNSISSHLMNQYLTTGESLDKAGAYGIQGAALTFVSKVDGCYSNVVGFPLARFCATMEQEMTRRLAWSAPWQQYFY